MNRNLNMVELTTHPNEILRATHGTHFLIKGEEFVLEELFGSWVLSKWRAELHEVDSDTPTKYLWEHLRDNTGRATLGREEIFKLLLSGNYVIY